MEPSEPLESHVLFVDAAGTFEVGTIDQIDGKYLQRQSGNFFQLNWRHVVAVGPHILFVRDDGLFEVGHIDQFDNQYVQTQSGDYFERNWTHVVAVGPHVLLVHHSGRFEVGHIDLSTGTYVRTEYEPGIGSDWTHVVAVGPHVLLVGNDAAGKGTFAVGHIDEFTGRYVPTGTGSPPSWISPGWTHVVAVGPHVLLVRDSDGQFEVGHIDESPPPTYVPTGTGPVFAGVTHLVAACSRVFLSGPTQFVVGHIDPSKVTSFVITQNPGPDVGGTPDPIHVVAVGPRVLSVSPTKTLGSVMHFNDLGQFVETESGPDFAYNWTHVVAVA
jgi:sporulation protein YlmC with PRC-barrel domain